MTILTRGGWTLIGIVFGVLTMARPAEAQIDLGTASSFTVLGGAAVTNAGATFVLGNVGVSPSSSITGFPPGTVTGGALHAGDALATQAQADAVTAYNQLVGETATNNLTGMDLGGLTLTSGVYSFASSAALTGTLTLNTQGNPNALFIFQIGSTLTTSVLSSVLLTGSLSDPNVFWQVGSSATLSPFTAFYGTILAQTSITVGPFASITDGRALALNGAVTLNTDFLGGPAVVVPGSFWKGGTNNLWSGDNWSPDVTGTTAGPLAANADVVFSANGAANENTNLDVDETISSLTVNDPTAVTIAGIGTLTLTGTGEDSGITINAGAARTTIDSTIDLGALSQTVTVNNIAGLVINGVIEGTNGLAKAGTGALLLTGANTYTGGTTINAGAVIVGSLGALGLGNVTNNATLETTAVAGLSGARTVAVNGGFTQTGTGVLALEVTTDQGAVPTTQAAAGVNYDTLAATGATAVAGTIDLNFNVAGRRGQRFQVVSSAASDVTGRFISPAVLSGAINPLFTSITTYNDSFDGTYAAHNVVVTLVQPFTTLGGLTPNQLSVARNVDQFIMGAYNNNPTVQAGAGATDFFNHIVTGLTTASLGTGAIGPALDELSPQRFEILRNVAFDNYAMDMQSLDDEFARERNGPGGLDTSGFTYNNSALGSQLSQVKSRLLAWSPAPERGLLSDSSQAILGGVQMTDAKDMKKMAESAPVNRWNSFIDGGADLGDLDSNIDESHASYTTGRVRGGADYLVAKNIRVGAFFGYSHTDADLDHEGSKAQIDSYTPGVFLTYADKQGFYANGLFTYTRNDYSTDRRIVLPGVDRRAEGSSGGNQFGGNLDGGYEFHKGAWTFGPSAGLTYVNLGIDSFHETGAQSASLNINRQSTDSLRSRLGGTVRYAAKVGGVTVTPHLSAYWQHEFLDSPTLITSQFEDVPVGTFSVQTTRGDGDNALVSCGVDADVTQNVTLFLDYQAEAGGDSFFGESASAGVKVAF